MRYLILLALVALAACDDKKPQVIPPANVFQAYYSVGVQVCDDFTFGEPHYCLKSMPAQMGQTVTITYTVEGTLYPVDVSMNPPGTPARLRIFVWRQGDNMTCAGAYQGYRQWSSTSGELTPGQHSFSVVLDPANFTDCFGAHSDLAGVLAQPLGIGFTFGGNDGGHGVRSYGFGRFHLDNFTVQ